MLTNLKNGMFFADFQLGLNNIAWIIQIQIPSFKTPAIADERNFG